MQRKLIFLINPISGTKKKSLLTRTIIDMTTAAGFQFEILETRADGNYSDLPRYVEKNGVTDVVVCGGDGSVSTVSAYLLNSNVAIGIIPTGSGNGLALAARIPYSTRRAMQIIFEGHSAYIDGYRINEKFSCMLCGIGNDAQVAHDFALTKVRGLKTYLRLSAKKYFTMKPFYFTLKLAEWKYDVNAFFITVSNSNQFGNNVTIAPRASLNDGLLDVVVVKKMNRLLLPFALLTQISGINPISQLDTPHRGKPILYFQAKELIIVNNDGAPLHIDGEPQPATKEIHIKILPDAFRLLQPFRPQGEEDYQRSRRS